jgi:hypothetical protein
MTRLWRLITTQHRFELLSPLSLEEARRTLTTSLKGNPYMHGRVHEHGFWIRMRRRDLTHNPFATYIFGRFVGDDSKTRIQCTAGLSRTLTLFVAAWFAGLAALTLSVIVVVASTSPTSLADVLISLATPVALAAIGAAIVHADRWQKPNTETQIIAYMNKTIATVTAPERDHSPAGPQETP